ncbi:GntR family transcriptional regulator [Rhodobacteraceae bacterium N5(2021)]|uniref:GntR family transcriptional regulator n=1 Tax=Gymnodinialimonas phycosphaerae TaxID=2841589 RepID=A0A975TVE2_9RHOB|nr:GntR family transcriptional regulator [Gymnodinialimonas phycosphaerae]MBY4891182.1 GntR family transcriptional regulator [Gymnodinialimonas phycosphaerae]
MSKTSGPPNLSERAYDKIRRDILNCILVPDERLQIDAVSKRYDIGAVPIREALNRLSSEGLVERRSHRGFCVAAISLADMTELVQTRIWLETLALRQSIENMDEALEEALVLSYHRLARTQRLMKEDVDAKASEKRERLHKAFHMLLLDNCGSSLLLGFCSQLMDQSVRYRNLSMNTAPSRLRREGAAAEHKSILDAVLDQDADLACKLLEDHYRITLEGLEKQALPAM